MHTLRVNQLFVNVFKVLMTMVVFMCLSGIIPSSVHAIFRDGGGSGSGGGGGGGGNSSCFPAGTSIIMGNGEKKNIEDIKAGDNVLSRDENGTTSVSIVSALERPVSDNMCEINLTDGERLHP